MSLLDMDMSDEIYERSIIEEWVNNLPNLPNIQKDFLSYSEVKNIYYSACSLSYNIDDYGNIPNLVKSINFTSHQLAEMQMQGIDENSHIPNICFSSPYPKFRLVKLSGNKLPVSDPRHDPIPDPRRPASPRPGRAPGARPTFTTGSR